MSRCHARAPSNSGLARSRGHPPAPWATPASVSRCPAHEDTIFIMSVTTACRDVWVSKHSGRRVQWLVSSSLQSSAGWPRQLQWDGVRASPALTSAVPTAVPLTLPVTQGRPRRFPPRSPEKRLHCQRERGGRWQPAACRCPGMLSRTCAVRLCRTPARGGGAHEVALCSRSSPRQASRLRDGMMGVNATSSTSAGHMHMTECVTQTLQCTERRGGSP